LTKNDKSTVFSRKYGKTNPFAKLYDKLTLCKNKNLPISAFFLENLIFSQFHNSAFE